MIFGPPEGRLLLQVDDRVEVLDADGTRRVLGDDLFALDYALTLLFVDSTTLETVGAIEFLDVSLTDWGHSPTARSCSAPQVSSA
jgi:hypothetical protein